MSSTIYYVIAGFTVYTWFLIGLAVCLSYSGRLILKYSKRSQSRIIQPLLLIKDALLWPLILLPKK